MGIWTLYVFEQLKLLRTPLRHKQMHKIYNKLCLDLPQTLCRSQNNLIIIVLNNLTLLTLHPAVSILAVLAIVTPVPSKTVTIGQSFSPVTVKTSHPALQSVNC